MDALLIGTGGARGWPEDGCRCASCMGARSGAVRRATGRVLVDGTFEVVAGQPLMPGTGSSPPAAYRIEQLPGGLDITGPDNSRMLLAAGPGEVPDPPAGARPYDIALLDLLGSPVQLGLLRSAGFVDPHTVVAALYTDHRIRSEQEMARRCEVWAAHHGQDGQLVTALAPAPVVVPSPHRTLIIGGARSGKSTEAELRLSAEPRVTYLAAGPFAPDSAAGAQSWTGPDGTPDTEWGRRVALHRARRPAWWQTVESLDIAGLLRQETDAVLIDGLGTWLAAIMEEAGMWQDTPRAASAVQAGIPADRPSRDPAEVVRARVDELIGAWRQTRALVVAVTDQVGSGLVPAYPAGRIFRDQLGWLNQRIAAESELNLQVTAGLVTSLPG